MNVDEVKNVAINETKHNIGPSSISDANAREKYESELKYQKSLIDTK
jgi:hypothetical protein